MKRGLRNTICFGICWGGGGITMGWRDLFFGYSQTHFIGENNKQSSVNSEGEKIKKSV